MSKEIIYKITNAFPDTFTTAIYFFNFGFIILIWLSLIVLLGCIFYFLAMILSPLKNISFIKNIINNISLYFADKLGFENCFHMPLFFCIGLCSSLCILSVPVSYFLQFQFKYAEHIVFLTSYQKNQTPNGDKICSLVADDKYIHLLGDNKVSIAPYYFYYLKVFNFIPFFTIEKNSPNGFRTQKCNEN